MSNTAYPLALAHALNGGDLFPDAATIQALGAGYVYAGTDEFASDLADLLGDAIAFTTPDYTAGIFTADNPTITGLSNGDVITSFVIYNDTGVAGTSRLVGFIDTDSTGAAINYTSDGSNLPVSFPGVTIISI